MFLALVFPSPPHPHPLTPQHNAQIINLFMLLLNERSDRRDELPYVRALPQQVFLREADRAWLRQSLAVDTQGNDINDDQTSFAHVG